MFVSGYCSSCLGSVMMADLDTHALEQHPGQTVYLTLYRPAPDEMARLEETLEEMTKADPPAGKKAGQNVPAGPAPRPGPRHAAPLLSRLRARLQWRTSRAAGSSVDAGYRSSSRPGPRQSP